MKPTLTGHHCETCGQFVRLYKRKILAQEAYRLIRLYKISKHILGREYFHVSEFYKVAAVTGSGDFAKLRYWGLIKEQLNDDETKRTSGCWKITEKGRLFVEGKLSVNKYALVFDSAFFGFDGEQVGILTCLKKEFNYNDLMNSL